MEVRSIVVAANHDSTSCDPECQDSHTKGSCRRPRRCCSSRSSGGTITSSSSGWGGIVVWVLDQMTSPACDQTSPKKDRRFQVEGPLMRHCRKESVCSRFCRHSQTSTTTSL
eukprot:3381739-Amphidinium_carterae.1